MYHRFKNPNTSSPTGFKKEQKPKNVVQYLDNKPNTDRKGTTDKAMDADCKGSSKVCGVAVAPQRSVQLTEARLLPPQRSV